MYVECVCWCVFKWLFFSDLWNMRGNFIATVNTALSTISVFACALHRAQAVQGGTNAETGNKQAEA